MLGQWKGARILGLERLRKDGVRCKDPKGKIGGGDEGGSSDDDNALHLLNPYCVPETG